MHFKFIVVYLVYYQGKVTKKQSLESNFLRLSENYNLEKPRKKSLT